MALVAGAKGGGKPTALRGAYTLLHSEALLLLHVAMALPPEDASALLVAAPRVAEAVTALKEREADIPYKRLVSATVLHAFRLHPAYSATY